MGIGARGPWLSPVAAARIGAPGKVEGRGGLPALLFRLENASAPEQFVGLADGMLAWFASHPGFRAARAVFVALLGAAMAPLGPGVRVPEALLEVRHTLATRVEQWKQQLLREGEQRGERRGAQRGEAALLLRLLERRFGDLPGWARERVAAADTGLLEELGLRLLDAASLEEVFA